LFVAPTASFSKGRAVREVVGWSNYKVRAKGPKAAQTVQIRRVLAERKKLEMSGLGS